MSFNPYFSQLRHEFQNDPYRDRFLAELEDHAEDLAESENRSSKSLNLNFMHKHFGDPKQVKKDFVNITRPWQKTTEVWEAIGIGLICPLGSFLAYILLGWLKGGLFSLFSPSETSIVLHILNSFSSPILILIFSFLCYRSGWKHLKDKQSESLWSEKFKVILVLSPIALMFFLFLIQILFKKTDFLFLFALFSNLLTALAARIHLPSIKTKQTPKKKKQPWSPLFSVLLFIYFLAFTLLRISGIPFDQSNIGPLFEIIEGFEFFVLGVFPIILSGRILVGAYIMMALLISAFLFALGWMVLKKRWSWISGTLMIYILSTFWISPLLFYQNLTFNVPSQAISTVIEKRQLGPFYALVKNNYHDLQDAFAYNIGFEQDQFWITQIERGPVARQFSFDPGLVSTKDIFSSKKRISFENEDFFSKESSFDWPNELDCQTLGTSEEGALQANVCSSLSFRGQTLISSDQLGDNFSYGIPFGDAVFSEDRQWLLLKISPMMTPTSVYLLDLRGLQS